MGENRDALDGENQGNRLGGRDFFSGNKIFGMVPEIAVERFRQAFDIAVVEQISGVMPSCDDAVRKGFQQLFIADIDAVCSEAGSHFFISLFARTNKASDLLLKSGSILIDKKTDDVDVLSIVFCGKFDSGDDFDAFFLSVCDGLLNTGSRIVVGQGKSGQPLCNRHIDKLGGRKASIGFVGMHMKVYGVQSSSPSLSAV